jgi:hypothetical protein
MAAKALTPPRGKEGVSGVMLWCRSPASEARAVHSQWKGPCGGVRIVKAEASADGIW